MLFDIVTDALGSVLIPKTTVGFLLHFAALVALVIAISELT